MPRRSSPLLLLVLIALLPAAALAEDDLLPDIITVEKRLHQHIFNWGFELGCVSLRLTNGTANIGAGPANIWGAPSLPDGTQPVYQRIWRADGSNWDRLAGVFVYHETHEHIHFEGWAAYRLREWLPGNGVGAILVEGEKTSFCLMDSNSHDLTLPGAPLAPVFTTCEDVQGISVGWEDRYGLNLPGQEIRICGVPPGTYWLESEADPDDHLLEEDESNNVARILVQMPPPPNCNDGEDDDGDGLVDFGADPGCSSLFSNRENPECDDGEDNDDDGFVDYPDDPECTSAARNAESESTCGLGAELALVVPALSWLHGARRRARSTRTAHRDPLV